MPDVGQFASVQLALKWIELMNNQIVKRGTVMTIRSVAPVRDVT
jgi:hypothetical protein